MNLADYERKVFSQFTCDGITLELVRRLNPPHSFLEIGSGSGAENCTRILAQELHWTGVWIDSEPSNVASAISIANPLGVRALCAHVSLKNSSYIGGLMPQHFGVLAIDIDGNDYHIWKSLCGGEYGLKPYLVIIEAQIQKPFDQPFIMPYDESFKWDHASQEIGASIYSMIELGNELGYTFVGKCPDYHSPNLFFTRKEFDGIVTG